jgi:hypothetical protein
MPLFLTEPFMEMHMCQSTISVSVIKQIVMAWEKNIEIKGNVKPKVGLSLQEEKPH